VQDWGITYEELERFYDQADYEIGLSGQAGNLNGELEDFNADTFDHSDLDFIGGALIACGGGEREPIGSAHNLQATGGAASLQGEEPPPTYAKPKSLTLTISTVIKARTTQVAQLWVQSLRILSPINMGKSGIRQMFL
jgi:hypothetical protein